MAWSEPRLSSKGPKGTSVGPLGKIQQSRFSVDCLRPPGATAHECDEVVQKTRVLLLVEQQRNRLCSYQGQGSFASFVTTTALRLFTRGRRQSGRDDEGEAALRRLPAMVDLERRVSRLEHQALFADAFHRAVQGLTSRERLLLQLSHVKGLSIDVLAPMFDISRATAARWVARAREALREGTLKHLAERTQLDREDVSGLVASLHTQFDVSLTRLLVPVDVLE